MTHPKWETVIGLEVHIQLNTKTKLFSGAPNRFGDEPNHNIDPVCTGQPGSLPVLNREAVRKAVQFGCAIGAEVALYSQFDRKSYFYPDSPRNFQITQFYHPIIKGGEIIADVGGELRAFAVEHAHIEDDAGMLKHFSSFAGVDDNRAGTPLIELVSMPCMHSPEEAVAYARAVKAIMQYIGASDCNMEEGSLRVDANVSVRPYGENQLRCKTEIKNMNSFSNLEKALEAEIKRQIKAYEQAPDRDPDEVIKQETFRWDPSSQKTKRMRTKEGSADYRYFPEPDLPPVVLTESFVQEIAERLPELPYQRKSRYIEELELSPYSAGVLTADKGIADYFEAALALAPHPRPLCNWITVEFFGRLKEQAVSLDASGILPEHISSLVNKVVNRELTGPLAKVLADRMVRNPGKSPEELIAEDPETFSTQADTGELEAICEEILQRETQSVADYREGKMKAFGFLMGQAMKATKGKAPPQELQRILKEKLESSA